MPLSNTIKSFWDKMHLREADMFSNNCNTNDCTNTANFLLSDMKGTVTYSHTNSPVKGKFAPIPKITKEVKNLLLQRNIKKLYSHQSKAIASVLHGHDTVIATPTASGKTMCYNIPVIDEIIKEKGTKALYIFPTKALAHDQLREITSLTEQLQTKIVINTFDGDTPKEQRSKIKQTADIIITNPDMLNFSVMPYHRGWATFLSGLKYIVIDEMHMYRGTFGSHTSNILERLRRICNFYGVNPIYICSTATIANPQTHAENLTGRKMVLIDENGAPAPEKEFAIYVPPYVNKEEGIRKSSRIEVANIAAKATSLGKSTIVFTTSKNNTEMLVKDIKRILERENEDSSTVQSYRSGYLPSERRSIERQLRDGTIKCIVSTNALELGIDIGSLDIAILHGYPGSIASTLQQIGRAGRRDTKSTAILVASASPLNIFLAYNPKYITSSPSETARINAKNPYIALRHILCSAKEVNFRENDIYMGYKVNKILNFYTKKGVLRREKYNNTIWYRWQGKSSPQTDIALRSTTPGQYKIVLCNKNKQNVIGTMDKYTAHTTLYPGAIYIHRGKSYLVTECNRKAGECKVTYADGTYYTQTESESYVKILSTIEENNICGWGKSAVRTKPHSFVKKDVKTGREKGKGVIEVPMEEKSTTSTWIIMPNRVSEYPLIGEKVVLCLINLLKNTLPLYLMCGSDDLEIIPELFNTSNQFRIYISDTAPGGIGLAEGSYNAMKQILETCSEIISTCPCEEGCPSCIGTEFLDKSVLMKSHVQSVIQEIIETLREIETTQTDSK